MLIDLEAAGLEEFGTPAGAAAASVDSQKKLMAMLVATAISILNMYWVETDRRAELKLKFSQVELTKVGMMLAALLKAEGHQ